MKVFVNTIKPDTISESQKIKISDTEQNLIDKNWELLNLRRQNLFNGTLLRFLSKENFENAWQLNAVADVKYKELVGLRSLDFKISENQKFQVLSVYILVQTSDEKYFFTKRDVGDWPVALDMPGGFLQEKHNIKNLEDFVYYRIYEDLKIPKENISGINFLGLHEAKNILELMSVYKIKLNISFFDLQKLVDQELYEIPENYAPEKHEDFFDIEIHKPLFELLTSKNSETFRDIIIR